MAAQKSSKLSYADEAQAALPGTWENYDAVTTNRSLDALVNTAAGGSEKKFCEEMPKYVHNFISSIVQSSLYRMYDDEMGATPDGPSRAIDFHKVKPKQAEYMPYNLIDTTLEKMLKAPKPANEHIWKPRAQLEVEPHIPPDIDWPAIKDFTAELGAQKINLYIKSWLLTCGWVHTIRNLPTIEKPFWFEHRYEVRLSIPTRRCPVPKHSVSVFFTLCQYKYRPKDSPVEVWYVVESFSQKHRPGKHMFNEEWLKNLLEHKAKLGEKLRF